MTHRGATSLLVVVVAVSSAVWGISATAQASALPLQWAAVLLDLLPHAAAVAAAILILRASAWWQRAALAYVAAFGALESLGLVRILPFASQFAARQVVWGVATSALALVTAATAVLTLRRARAEGDRSVPASSRWAAVAGGLLLVASSMFAWTVTEHAPAGRWTFALSHTSIGVLVGSLVGMAVVAGITAVVAVGPERSLAVGATVGLLGSRPLALGVFADKTWQDADAMLAVGWWIALIAQILIVVALLGALGRSTGEVRLGRGVAPTN